MTLTYSRLREVLHYNPETGVFTWLPRPLNRRWTTRFAGKQAGCIQKVGSGGPYRTITVDNKFYYAHRLAFLYMTGKWPVADAGHRDLDGLNNRWKNLREASRSENLRNTKIRSDSTTGFRGVVFFKPHGRYRARITVNRRDHHLGYFDTAEEAHAAYIRAAKKYFGEFARA